MRSFILLFLVTIATSLSAGPWPRAKGDGYLKLYEFWLRFDEHYTSTGELDPNATLGLYNTAIYGEYGLTDRFTAVVNLPFYSRNVINEQVSGTRGDVLTPGEAISGLGDADIALRYGLNKPGAKFPVALTLTLGLPLGEDRGGELNNLQTGDGEFNQMLELSAGRSLGNNAYATASFGVNNRTNGFSDELRFGLEAGYALADRRVWLIGRLTGSESFQNGETAATFSSTSVFSNNAEYLSLGGEVNVYVTDKIGLSAGAATALSGRIIAAAPAYSAGIFVDLGK
ncbi:hypothetical protein FUA23_09075 [Neolewinella aurantiaca]|uniref:Transporter n=1 Tax=Neolewinella aurantiaca TaxID=2602767 RepID=A0A5C7FTL3_9BACT|nr:hypothetical protein [Neolewinella aurantiaca]TXF89827.1 hypothetical protein FUA23_09075 [Neolewinella aurantiaca]